LRIGKFKAKREELSVKRVVLVTSDPFVNSGQAQ